MKYLSFFERCSLALQLILHVNRVKNLDWEIKLGPNWVSITDDLVVTLLNEDPLKTDVWSRSIQKLNQIDRLAESRDNCERLASKGYDAHANAEKLYEFYRDRLK
ncbi:MAG: hypothetical protein ACI4OP_07070 [Candidatus Coprovivens sp.]